MSSFLRPFSNKKNQGPLEKQLILAIGQDIYMVGLKSLVVPGNKEMLKKKLREYSRGTQKLTKRPPSEQNWSNLVNNMNK